MRKPRRTVILIACFGFATLVVLTFLPNTVWLRRKADEASAVSSLRSIDEAEHKHFMSYPHEGFNCSLASLDQHLFPRDLVTGEKDGYIFTISGCKGDDKSPRTQNTTFKVTAVPLVVGKTGSKGFCSDEKKNITFDPSGGTDCREPIR